MNRFRAANPGTSLCVGAGFFIFLVCTGPFGRAQEFQAWNEVDLTALWRRIDFLATFVARIDPDTPSPQLAATGLTADLALPKGLTITPGYLFADLPQANYLVHLPLIALTETTHLSRLTLADRNRFEKPIGYPGSPVRYRNRLLLDCPLGFDGRAHLFIDDEVFFNLSAGNFNQNRFQFGSGIRFHPRFLLDLYYLQKNPGSGTATYIFGTTLRVTLTRHATPALACPIPPNHHLGIIHAQRKQRDEPTPIAMALGVEPGLPFIGGMPDIPKILLIEDDTDVTDASQVVWAFARQAHPSRGEIYFKE